MFIFNIRMRFWFGIVDNSFMSSSDNSYHTDSPIVGSKNCPFSPICWEPFACYKHYDYFVSHIQTGDMSSSFVPEAKMQPKGV